MTRKGRILIGFILFVLITFGGSFIYYQNGLKAKNSKDLQTYPFMISEGEVSQTVVTHLNAEGLIKDAFVFKLYTRLNNPTFKAGVYQISPSYDVETIVAMFKAGPVSSQSEFRITIPEGKKLEDIAELFAQQTVYSQEELITAWNNPQYVDQMIKKYWFLDGSKVKQAGIRYALEGYLFPDTYIYAGPSLSETAYSDYMLDTLANRLAPYKGQIEASSLSFHEILTLASITQGEAYYAKDFQMIAGVWFNRLDRGMPLQSDITVLYAKNEHQIQVFYEDLKVDSPYNTYRVSGIPIGPINSPGIMSIDAVLNPAKHDYLYFFSREDGTTIFSKTLEEHQKAAEENKWSTWQ